MSPSLTRAAPSQAFVGSRGPGSEDPEGTRPSPEGAGRALRHGSPRPARGGAIFPGGGRGHRSVPRPRRAQDPRGPGGAASACPGCGRRARPGRGAGPGAGARGDPAGPGSASPLRRGRRAKGAPTPLCPHPGKPGCVAGPQRPAAERGEAAPRVPALGRRPRPAPGDHGVRRAPRRRRLLPRVQAGDAGRRRRGQER